MRREDHLRLCSRIAATTSSMGGGANGASLPSHSTRLVHEVCAGSRHVADLAQRKLNQPLADDQAFRPVANWRATASSEGSAAGNHDRDRRCTRASDRRCPDGALKSQRHVVECTIRKPRSIRATLRVNVGQQAGARSTPERIGANRRCERPAARISGGSPPARAGGGMGVIGGAWGNRSTCRAIPCRARGYRVPDRSRPGRPDRACRKSVRPSGHCATVRPRGFPVDGPALTTSLPRSSSRRDLVPLEPPALRTHPSARRGRRLRERDITRRYADVSAIRVRRPARRETRAALYWSTHIARFAARGSASARARALRAA